MATKNTKTPAKKVTAPKSNKSAPKKAVGSSAKIGQ